MIYTQVKYLRIVLITGVLLSTNYFSSGQNTSVHREESGYYSKLFQQPDYKPEPVLVTKTAFASSDNCQLNKIVFGYHPYWGGNSFVNYEWNLLSDLCYFSYEVEPATGLPRTTNNWETAAVIDSAHAHGVRVHLCVTLFDGHYTFFTSASAQDTLINQVISKMLQRNAIGVNIDVEALPSSVINAYNAFLVNIAEKVHQAIPGSIVSIAAPAVDWNHELLFPLLENSIDYYMVMTYDYYWNGSSQAGPIAPLYPMTAGFNYSVKQSIVWYLANIPPSKLILGLPYYGRDWPVENPLAPSNTAGSASTLRYKTIRNNYISYSPENLRFEPNSLSPYYSYNLDKWHQCFMGDTNSLGLAYDQVNSHKLAGAGIWALGYDDGYPELWSLIQDKITDCKVFSCTDTLYDSGGPAFNYGNSEHYVQTFSISSGQVLRLEFLSLNLEAGYDSIWIYDGTDTLSPLLAALSGNVIPAEIIAGGNTITLEFKSDNLKTFSGWKAVVKCPTAAVEELQAPETGFEIFPNPSSPDQTITIKSSGQAIEQILISDVKGINRAIIPLKGKTNIILNPTAISLSPGIYIVRVIYSDGKNKTRKLLIF